MGSLEKAARAACEIDGGRWDDPSYPPHLQEQIRKEYLAQARAVLLAVREPDARTSDAMSYAAHNGPARHPDAVGQFRSMIDAILEKGDG
jgi:hypothetical protein